MPRLSASLLILPLLAALLWPEAPAEAAAPAAAGDVERPSNAATLDPEALRKDIELALAELDGIPAPPLASERRSVLLGLQRSMEVAEWRASTALPDAGSAPVPDVEGMATIATTELDAWQDELDILSSRVEALRAALPALGEQSQRDHAAIRAQRSEQRLWEERRRALAAGSPEADDAEARASLALWRARSAEFVWSEGLLAKENVDRTLPALESRREAVARFVEAMRVRQRLDERDLAAVLGAIETQAVRAESALERRGSRSAGPGPEELATVAAERERIAVLRGQQDVWRLRAKALAGTEDALPVLDEAIRQLQGRRRWAEGQLAFAEGRDAEGDEARARRALVALLDRSLVMLQRARVDHLALHGEAEAPGWAAQAGRAIAAQLMAVWEWELFVVTERQTVDGREITQEHGVTVGKSLGVLLLVLLGYGLVRAFSHLLRDVLLPRAGIDRQRARTITRWVSGLLLVAVVLVVLKLARIPLVAFAFLGGALAIGIGFGAQTLLKNIMSGALVLLERRIRVGDVLTVGGASGTCTDIGLRSTTIAGFDGIELIVPNAILLESTVNNWTGASMLVRREVALVVPCDGRERESAAIVAACAAETAGVLEEPAPKVLATRFVDGGVELVAQVWVRMGGSPSIPDIESALRLEIARRLFDQQIAMLPPLRVALVPWPQNGPAAVVDGGGA